MEMSFLFLSYCAPFLDRAFVGEEKMKNYMLVVLLLGVFAPLSTVYAKTEITVINSGFTISGQSESNEGLSKIEFTPVIEESYGRFLSDNSTCNADGTMQIDSSVEWAQLEGTIQTGERNSSETSHGPTEERIIRGPEGTSSGNGGWNSGWIWTLEEDGTGFETIRGRDGATLSDTLIYETTVRYDCNGVEEGGPAFVTFENYHRSADMSAVPTLSVWGLVLMGLLLTGVASRRMYRVNI